MVNEAEKIITTKRGKFYFMYLSQLTIRSKTNKYAALSIFLLIFFSQLALATSIKVSLGRQTINAGESVQLIFSASQSPANEPDFSPLNKDFDIINQSQGSKMSWINGNVSKRITWTLNMIPKKIGNRSIPPIAFGQDSSAATILHVIEKNSLHLK